MPERWLIVSHQATNSGAPRMLLDVLRGMRALRGEAWQCDVLLGSRGPKAAGSLESAFERLGRVRTLLSQRAEYGSKLMRGLDRLLRQPARLERWRAEWSVAKPDLIFANTATNGRILDALSSLRCPVITHVHELGYSLQRFVRPGQLAAVVRSTNRFFAVSQAVFDDLVSLGIAAERIARVPNFLPELPALPDVRSAKSKVAGRLGLPDGAQIVTGCGHIDPLKGTDRFVEIASACGAGARHPLAFIWLGGEVDRSFAARLREQIRQSGVGDRIRLAGPVSEPELFFAASDVVVVTSRAESFGRVALEAGALGRPVLAFAEARGPADLLSPESLLAEASSCAMASAVSRLLAEPTAGAELGAALRKRIGRDFLADKWIREIARHAEEVCRA